MESHFQNHNYSALEAQYEAQKIAFAPVIFQVARTMRDLGILKILLENDPEGLSFSQIKEKTKLSEYALQVLLESSLSGKIIYLEQEKYHLSKIGYFLENDEMTRINMDFIHNVNYLGLYDLDKSIESEKPEGLKIFGDWETIYPEVSSLPENAKESWFRFDHYYSDSAFPDAIEIISKMKPTKVLDIGGNTGKFSIALAKADSRIKITIADLPKQIRIAKENAIREGLGDQIDVLEMNVLEEGGEFPGDYDIIWMSQFLDCFSGDQIQKILKKAKNAMNNGARLCIMEPLWDKQRFETSAYCIINTSPYFTALANGKSKMFHSRQIKDHIEKSGLNLESEIDSIGLCQSLLICKV